jgi:uncharacterized protein
LESTEPRRPFPLSLGLNKLGLFGLRAPLLSALVVIALTGLAALGLLRIKVDDSLSELFRTNTSEFKTYEEIDRLFPSSEYDVLVVVEGNDLLQRKGLETFANLTT